MPGLLILTVGTGTTGNYSDLTQGLINTIGLASPRLFWLVPSAHGDSIGVAQLIREGCTSRTAFQAWSSDSPFRCIQSPDDIFDCRAALCEVISAARKQLRRGESLTLNPTSGTKQMSAGATLAALDEGVGDIVFTVGERRDGVVKTGTEKLAPFSTVQFLFERDLRIAEDLFLNGAFKAAASVLKPYTSSEATTKQAAERAFYTALCLHEWHRLNYGSAANHAARFSEDLRCHLKRLSGSDECSPIVLGDMLSGADELLRWGDVEEALARYYRSSELAAKVRLGSEHGLKPTAEGGYPAADVDGLPGLSSGLRAELPRRSGVLHLGSDLIWRILEDCSDPMADAYFADEVLRSGLRQRNQSVYGHGSEPCNPARVREVGERLRSLIKAHIPQALSVDVTALRPLTLSRNHAVRLSN